MLFVRDPNGYCNMPLSRSAQDETRLFRLIMAVSQWLTSEPYDRLLVQSVECLLRNHVLPVAILKDGPLSEEEDIAAEAFEMLAEGDPSATELLQELDAQELSTMRRIQAFDPSMVRDRDVVTPDGDQGACSFCIHSDLIGKEVRLDPVSIRHLRQDSPNDLVSFLSRIPGAGGVFTVMDYQKGSYFLDRCLCEIPVQEEEIVLASKPVLF